MAFWDSAVFTWIILPILIFSARILDVSIGTLRIVYLARGRKIIVPILGFFEVVIWLVAIGEIFKHLDNAVCYMAYAGGFAMGNYVGIVIENKLAIGLQIIRIIARSDTHNLIEQLKNEGYGITVVDGQGSTGPVKIIFTLIQRRDFIKVAEVINRHNPKAFFTVEDVQMAREAILPAPSASSKKLYWHLFRMDRKRK